MSPTLLSPTCPIFGMNGIRDELHEIERFSHGGREWIMT